MQHISMHGTVSGSTIVTTTLLTAMCSYMTGDSEGKGGSFYEGTLHPTVYKRDAATLDLLNDRTP